MARFITINKYVSVRTLACLTAAFAVNILIFFVIQQMVTGEYAQGVSKNIEVLVNYVRRAPDRSPPEARPKPEELEEPPPEQELPEPDLPKPALAPPAPISAVTSAVPAPDIPIAKNGMPLLDKILKVSRGRLKSPVVASNLVPTLKIPPIYPQQALRMGIEGIVTVEFIIAVDGSVKNPKIVKARPEKIFDQAVLQAIKRWKYQPEMVNGKPVERRARQDISFNLEE